jgi:hypothetical protein
MTALALLSLPVTGAEAQEGVVTAMRIPGGPGQSIRLDGLLDEPIWEAADVIDGLRQREPGEGAPASERTEVRIAFDDEALYVGVIAYDSDPERVVARILQRDKVMTPVFLGAGVEFAGDDAVAILLDPFDDNRNGVIFATNPNGAEFEALLTDEGSQLNVDWRGVWEVRAARTEQGWSAEFAIPWRTLRYPDRDTGHEWGINVQRVIRRKNEDVLWQSWQREGGGLHRVSRAGRLAGLSDLPRQGLNAEVKPFVLTGRRQEADDFGAVASESQYEVGLDLKTELRPGLLLDLTLNTDFAQVEVDDAQVNLTRFDLFFPEKRDFFLENAGIFDFGIPGNPFEPPAYQMFFSRQIGISEDDGEVPILGGGRLSGRVGAQTLGFMTVVTDRAYDLPRETFSVGRVKRDVGSSGYVGAMLVDRRSAQGWNTSVGVDGQFVIGSAWVWDWYGARSITQGEGGDGFSYRVGYSYEGDTWGSLFNHYAVSPSMEAEAGFITRTDIRRTDLYGSRKWRPEAMGLRDISVWAGAAYGSTVTDNRLQDWEAGIGANPLWESGENALVFASASETVVDESFELTDSVEVPPGRYRADNIGWVAGTSQNRPVYLESTGVITRFHGGSLVSVGGTLTAAPSSRLALALGFTRNDVEVPDGSFTADISSLRATLSFSTRLSTNLLLQYNSLDREITTNLRFNFIHRPGSDLFIVFTENRGDDRRVWNLSNRGLVMKLTYLARM